MNDIRFLERIKTASLSELEAMLRDHSHKSTPKWKQVAIRRAIARHRPCSREWVLGLDVLKTSGMPTEDRLLIEEARRRA